MTSTPLAYGWEIKFKLACHERRGEAYQELFASIMERRDPGFQRVRPWGNRGDRKNDGWSPARRILFQCYAPKSFDENKLLEKLEADYEGAKDYWEPYFDQWTFVHDDIDGLGPAVALLIEDLNRRSDNITCIAWGFPELREEFACLEDSHKTALLGPVLTQQDFMSVEAETLRPLMEALGRARPDVTAPVTPVPPEKLYRNELSNASITCLQWGASRAPLVEMYLSGAFVLPTYADEVAQAMAAKYRQYRESIASSDDVLTELLAFVTGGAIDSQAIANGFAILAYLFERCSIFEPGVSPDDSPD